MVSDFPDSWKEVALLTLYDGTTKQNFALITESFDIATGEKGMEGLATVAGGRIKKYTPETDTEFTAKIIPVGVGLTTETSMTGFWQRFQPQGTADATDPIQASVSRTRNTYTTCVMWATTLPADAVLAPASSVAALRFTMHQSEITSLKHTFTTSDGLMADVTIKTIPFDKSGIANVIFESCIGSGASLAAVTFKA